MLAPGTQLGPYEILAPLGAGGMGHVFRAKDPRLGREVAIKVLPPALSRDPDRLRRFEIEARAAGMLNHPNILAIYDVGTYQGSPYLVSELLEGETLRARLHGATLPPRKSIDFALQIARGLAAAHEKGIFHRDLKPENLFVTRDGRLKILDFGLAKLVRPEPSDTDDGSALTNPDDTEPDKAMGTVGYMSPEQVRNRPADHRSDIFNFGLILHEMLTGKRAFRRESAVETMNAILKEDAPEISATHPNISPALERIVGHCLEKAPDERFRSAHDLVFDLESLAGASGPSAVPVAPARPRRRLLPVIAALVLAAAVLAGGLVFRKRLGTASLPAFQQVTFRRGFIDAARFGPDGHTIIYGAAWDGKSIEPFSMRPNSTDFRAIGLAGAGILAVSSSGEMALSLGNRFVSSFVRAGTLARASLDGGVPREILEDVQAADWAPDAGSLAVVRTVSGRRRLEFPIGKTLYEAPGWISHPRVSPQGNRVAFIDHPARGDDGGGVAVVDLAGNKTALSTGWISVQGLAWTPNGEEVWFTATKAGIARALYAVSLSGKERLLARVPGVLTLQDISRPGRVLIRRDHSRIGLIALPPGDSKGVDLSWLDSSIVRDISADGKTILFDESGEGGGARYAIFLRKTDGSAAVRIGEGTAQGLSPDGKWALSIIHHTSARQLVLLPTGPGQARPLEREGLQYHSAGWLPDGSRILAMANEAGRGVRFYVQDLAGGKPRAITPEGVGAPWVRSSPDGRSVIGLDQDRKPFVCPVEGGAFRSIPGLTAADLPIQWSADGRSLYVYRPSELPAKVYRLDLATGRKTPWKQLMPADPAGVVGIGPVHMTPDGKSLAYSYSRILSDLYVIDGLK